ncbi:MAG TPA: non-homologous end-joining DNA ligase [Vicinamibacteria bacterium]|nr:non-homologous end-joining DNA ligase [Vicinamibacteria bacterium]
MLAATRERPFSGAGWIFELKLDGFRLLAARERRRPRLLFRNGGDATGVFPEVARAVAGLPFDGLVMDGELVILDQRGHPIFQELQKRLQLRRALDVERAVRTRPAVLFVFDLLAAEGFDLRPLRLADRKRLLYHVLAEGGPLRFAEHVDEDGERLFAELRRLGLEGMIGKRADSPYRAGRSRDWVKVMARRTGDFVVVGYTRPEGSRTGFGSLHLGLHEEGRLVYAGRVGSGFHEAQLVSLRALLDAHRLPRCPCVGPAPRGAAHTWVAPRLVCEVRYRERTAEGLLRHPVFVRFHTDKRPEVG